MSWKKFLRSTAGKIIISVVLSTVLFFVLIFCQTLHMPASGRRPAVSGVTRYPCGGFSKVASYLLQIPVLSFVLIFLLFYIAISVNNYFGWNWEGFLKPNISKVIASPILLFAITSWHAQVVRVQAGGPGRFGLPLHWLVTAAAGPGGQPIGGGVEWFNLIVDLIVWYLVGCLLIYLARVLMRKYK